jgi:Icc protein
VPPSVIRMRILHISDTHLLDGGRLHNAVVDTHEAMFRVLRHFDPDHRIQLVVASGDLSDDGSVRSYRLLRDALEPWAASRGARVVYAMGNHDLREGFAAVLGGDPAGPIDSVTQVAGVRVIALDSAVPGAGYGRLRPEQLERLRRTLAEPAERGSVVVVHHPPVPAATVLLQGLALQDPDELLRVIEGTDVRAVLAGHYHHPLATVAAGVPVIVSGGIANTADVLAPVGVEHATRGSSATVIDLEDDGSVRATAVHVPGPGDGETVLMLDREAVQRILRESGVPAATEPFDAGAGAGEGASGAEAPAAV